MKKIVSLQGGMASGKTTLAKRIGAHRPEIQVVYENPYPVVKKRNEQQFDIFTEEGFTENQRLFIEAEIKRFENLPDGKIIFDRGPEDVEFYTLHFPLANGFSWDMELRLKHELAALRKCKSHTILYLDADAPTLLARKTADHTRFRGSFQKNMKLYEFEREWYKQFPTVFIDTDTMTIDELEAWTLKFLKEIDFI